MNAPLPAQGLIAATPLTETSFSVPGMRCAACISKLETGLPRTAGIVSARVNLTAKRVAIAHLPALTPPELQAAIAGLGFEAQPLGQALASDTADDSRELLRAMAVAGFAQAELDLTVQENTLIVTGATADAPEAANDRVFLHRGIAKRAFERRFQLADTIKVTGASYENGLLNIDLVREVPEHKKPRKVEIGNAPTVTVEAAPIDATRLAAE